MGPERDPDQGLAEYEIGRKRGWQGRKDSNLGPSVLETDALTRLSYAPIRKRFYPDARLASRHERLRRQRGSQLLPCRLLTSVRGWIVSAAADS